MNEPVARNVFRYISERIEWLRRKKADIWVEIIVNNPNL